MVYQLTCKNVVAPYTIDISHFAFVLQIAQVQIIKQGGKRFNISWSASQGFETHCTLSSFTGSSQTKKSGVLPLASTTYLRKPVKVISKLINMLYISTAFCCPWTMYSILAESLLIYKELLLPMVVTSPVIIKVILWQALKSLTNQ